MGFEFIQQNALMLLSFAGTSFVLILFWLRRLARAMPAPAVETPEPQPLATQDTSLLNLHPYPMWIQAMDGTLVWNNTAFIEHGELLIQRVQSLREATSDVGRISIETDDDQIRWFDIHHHHCPQGELFLADPADAEVRADASRREFVQTLSKTFAQLSTGLAIFDRSRALVLFNPALLELTGLRFEALSQYPSLHTFLDQLREHGLIPEPRDYAAWRSQIAELETAASEGSYCETWQVASGQTFQVTGRPHPDGAIAFMIQDISAEVSLSRRFRAELDLCYGVMDQLPNAIAVFSEAGVLTMANQAYSDLWKHDPLAGGIEFSIIDCTRLWQLKSTPSDLWPEIQKFVHSNTHRDAWTQDTEMHNGTAITVRCAPLPGRMTMVEFSQDWAAMARPIQQPQVLAQSA